MKNRVESLKAVFFGCATIILVGYGLSFLSFSVESMIVDGFYAEPATRAELLKAMFWPGTITISIGVFISFAAGGFVVARMSTVHPALSALVPALLFVAVLWIPVFLRSDLGQTVPANFSTTSLFAAAIGGWMGMKAADQPIPPDNAA